MTTAFVDKLAADFELRITRRVPNPAFKKNSSYNNEPMFLEHEVTLVTLDAEQWQRVQSVIVEALTPTSPELGT
jgi:hypothetical protein